ncbi:VWA domain-containing protein [Echinicola vietnamensis]|uniref:Mg-chelatase subunit ChlD n=1 Tax=Echinicola vietnamensis (strain DSM 17526 / LMG 23754 / KMM 6221) TaxID=926556 RepID=L0G5D0_ECHVK|nr:VWA domain-containing protein [Echinicola vietnamensis]AGA80757.1 Mg-chelatase subunit ChlD [Echinicola vietnamensis DSM 17526]
MFEDLFPIDWEAFHFLRPTLLWGFAGVGLLLVLGLANLQERMPWKKHIAPHLRPFMIAKGSGRMKLIMHLLMVFGLSLGVLALAGPTWKKVEVPGQVLETPMVILLDLSQSMLADDIQPNRLERAKFKVADLLDARPGARVALVGYAGTAHTIVPLTSDYNIIKSHIETLSPKVMPFRGSDLSKGLALADSLMAVTAAPGTVLLLSDDFSEETFKTIQGFMTSRKGRLEIMPFNTPSGGEVPAYAGSGSLTVGGKAVHSAMDATVLSQLGSLENCRVHTLTLDDSDVKWIAEHVRENLRFTEEPEEKQDQWRDAGLLLVIPAALILLMWFRRGWVVFGLAVMLSSCGQKEPLEGFADLWYTRDYQGQRKSDVGDFEEAAKLYHDPLRKGVAFYKAGDYDDAIQALSQDTTAMGSYNLGLAYFKVGDYAAAQMAFGMAAVQDPTLAVATKNKQALDRVLSGGREMDPASAEEQAEKGPAKTRQNKSPEDLSGGGQEATKKDMEKERLSETATTGTRTAKEMDEVPDDFKSGGGADDAQKVLLRKIDDDPARFLQKKFEFEVKRKKIKPDPNEKAW